MLTKYHLAIWKNYFDGRGIRYYFFVYPVGVWMGSHTPNLNEDGRFVRGGNPEDVLTMESHSIEGKGQKL